MRTRLKAAALGVAVIALLAAPAALGVHAAGLFELEGNALDEPLPGDDWSQPDGSGFGTTGFAQVFVRDETGHSDGHFFRGSKTNEPISQWFWMRGPVAPAKDDLVHAFATAYRDDGDLFVYFGADRLSNEGAAGLGFWFLQDDVDALADGTFSGSHQVGDMLIVSQFTEGGDVSIIEVYRWVGGDDPLALVARGEDCTTEPPGGNFCATVNETTTPAPWPYDARDSGPVQVPAGVFPPGAFFEGGINVSAVLPETECFSSFMALTSPSHVVQEELKDFVLGPLETCPRQPQPRPPGAERRPDLVLTKTDSPDVVPVGGTIKYSILVRNVGRAAARDVVVRDRLPTDKVEFLSASTTQGSCGQTAPQIVCRLGTIAAGAAVRITIRVRATEAGSATDVAVVTRAGPEVTPAGNRDVAVTRIRAAGVAGAEQVGVCASLRILGSPTVSPGERATIRLRARSRAGGALSGPEVVARGPGVSAVEELNARGLVSFTIRPTRAGVVRFFVRGAANRCTARLGVVQAVTGGRLTG